MANELSKTGGNMDRSYKVLNPNISNPNNPGYENRVQIIEKDGLEGLANANGEIIIPCKFKDYSALYAEWKDLGYPSTANQVMTAQGSEQSKFKQTMLAGRNELVTSGGIKEVTY